MARWFTSHTVSVEQLRNAPLTRAPQDLLGELINDLPQLRQILSALPTNASHFQLLSNTTANLETFLRIYEPHAVENNNEVPLINFDAEVSRVLAIVSVITAQGMMRGLPLETVSHYLNKTLAKEHPLVVQEAMQLHEEQQNRLFEEMMLLSASPASAEVRKLAAAGADAFQQAHGDSSRDETLGDDGPPNPQDFKVEDDNSAPGFFGLPFARGAKIVPVSPEQKTEAVASAATRSVSLPIWMLPLHIISPVITTSFSGFKSVGSGLLSFVKTSWGQLSDNLAASDSTEMFAVHSFDDTKNDTSDETKKSLSEPTQQQNNFQKPQRLSPPQVDGFALAQVTIPLVSKMCKRHGLFGYKLLTPEQITHYRTHYEAQLNLIKASLDEMLKHPILQRQKEVHLAEEALKQAQSRFKNTFKKKPHLNVNRSQQADIDHLVEIAQENLQCAKVVQAKVEQQIPELMDELCESAEMNIAHKFLGEPPPQYPQFGSMYFLAPTRYSAMQPIAQDQEPASVNEGEGSNPLALYLLKTSIKP
ncbi:MAG: hypothetical protein K0Q74_1267 [Gammaproteobacteria bacterium]|nr:hypothetical protein [Gammaproteobacteria bacterium]